MSKIAFIGCAHIHTPGFIKRILSRNDVEVVAVWDENAARSQHVADELGTARVATLEEAISAQSDGVIVLSETDRHVDFALPAIERGRHVFIEKPLGHDKAAADRIAGAVEEAGVIFQTGYFQRSLAPHLYLRDHIRKGTFGAINRVRLSFCHSGAIRDIFRDYLWMTERSRTGVGAFGDLGAHLLDLLVWLLGDVESVTAATGRAIAAYGEDCDEYGEGLVRLKNGALASLAAGWVDAADPITLQISGTKATAFVRDRAEVYMVSEALGQDGSAPVADLPAALPHALDLYLDALDGKPAPLVSVREAANVTALLGACYQAIDTNAWVSVDS